MQRMVLDVWWRWRVVLAMSACGKKNAAGRAADAAAAAGSGRAAGTRPPAPPEPVAEPTIVPPEPVRDDAISSASLDDLNRNSPLQAGVLRARQQRARRAEAQTVARRERRAC